MVTGNDGDSDDGGSDDSDDSDSDGDDDDSTDDSTDEATHKCAAPQCQPPTYIPGVLGVHPPSCLSLGGRHATFTSNTCTDEVVSASNFTNTDIGISECSPQDLNYSRIIMVKRFGCEIELPFPPEVFIKGCTGDSNQGTFRSGDPVEDVEPMQVTVKRSTYGEHDIHEMVEVNEPNTHFPWSAVAYISNGCTGTFVGPRHVLTAGHCVYNYTTGSWYKNLDVWRAKDCNPDCGHFHKWKMAITVKGWARNGLSGYDYAMIVVDQPSPVYLSLGWWDPIPLGRVINIAGYPGAVPGNCLWRVSCPLEAASTFQMGYFCDTYDGMSGSPMYMYWPSSDVRRRIYCVHRAGGRTSTNTFNSCTRITRFRFHQLSDWISPTIPLSTTTAAIRDNLRSST